MRMAEAWGVNQYMDQQVNEWIYKWWDNLVGIYGFALVALCPWMIQIE